MAQLKIRSVSTHRIYLLPENSRRVGMATAIVFFLSMSVGGCALGSGDEANVSKERLTSFSTDEIASLLMFLSLHSPTPGADFSAQSTGVDDPAQSTCRIEPGLDGEVQILEFSDQAAREEWGERGVLVAESGQTKELPEIIFVGSNIVVIAPAKLAQDPDQDEIEELRAFPPLRGAF